MMRQVLNLLYNDKIDVYETRNFKDNKNFLTNQKETLVYSDVACRCSYMSVESSQKTEDEYYKKQQSVKIILAPDIDIKAGAKIIVTKAGGQRATYKASGQRAIYPSHQEIVAEILEVIA